MNVRTRLTREDDRSCVRCLVVAHLRGQHTLGWCGDIHVCVCVCGDIHLFSDIHLFVTYTSFGDIHVCVCVWWHTHLLVTYTSCGDIHLFSDIHLVWSYLHMHARTYAYSFSITLSLSVTLSLARSLARSLVFLSALSRTQWAQSKEISKTLMDRHREELTAAGKRRSEGWLPRPPHVRVPGGIPADANDFWSAWYI